MYAKNYHIWLGHFKEKKQKCVLASLFWTTLYMHTKALVSGIILRILELMRN